jgi:hypothetical protein
LSSLLHQTDSIQRSKKNNIHHMNRILDIISNEYKYKNINLVDIYHGSARIYNCPNTTVLPSHKRIPQILHRTLHRIRQCIYTLLPHEDSLATSPTQDG